VTQQADKPNDLGRNFLLRNRKKIAKFLMRPFTCRSTFLYDMYVQPGALGRTSEGEGKGSAMYCTVYCKRDSWEARDIMGGGGGRRRRLEVECR
jgi:hypothetical protein